METVQQNGRFTFFSSKFHSNIYSILFGSNRIPILKYLRFTTLICKDKGIRKFEFVPKTQFLYYLKGLIEEKRNVKGDEIIILYLMILKR